MVKEQLIEQTAKGNWAEAAGLGIAGLVMSLGIGYSLIILFGLLAVGLVTMVYLLPVVLAGAVGLVTYLIGSRAAKLSGIKLVAAVVLASLGSLVVFSFTDITLWAAGKSTYAAALGGEATAENILTSSVRVMQLIVGAIFSGFVILLLLVFRSAGMAGGMRSMGAGLLSAAFAGVFASSAVGSELPGQAAEIGTTDSTVLSIVAVSFLVAGIVSYLYWRLD